MRSAKGQKRTSHLQSVVENLHFAALREAQGRSQVREKANRFVDLAAPQIKLPQMLSRSTTDTRYLLPVSGLLPGVRSDVAPSDLVVCPSGVGVSLPGVRFEVGWPASFPGVGVPPADGGAGCAAAGGSSAYASEVDIARAARIASTFFMVVSLFEVFLGQQLALRGATVDFESCCHSLNGREG
jgi:hypothetical protein